MPSPPGVIGIVVRMRISAHEANASVNETSDGGNADRSDRDASTRNTVRCPARVASVSGSHGAG